mgnify:FL=1
MNTNNNVAFYLAAFTTKNNISGIFGNCFSFNRSVVKNFLSLIAVLCLLNAGIVYSQNWQYTNGPNYLHNVKDLASGKSGSSQKIYAADVETLKISTDNGVSWKPTTDVGYSLSPLVVGCYTTNPQYAAWAKSGQIWKTDNSGDNWNAVTNPAPTYTPTRLNYHSTNSNIIFLGT